MENREISKLTALLPWWYQPLVLSGFLTFLFSAVFVSYCVSVGGSYSYLAGGTIGLIASDLIFGLAYLVIWYHKAIVPKDKAPVWLRALNAVAMVLVYASAIASIICISFLSLSYYLTISALVLIAGNGISIVSAIRGAQYIRS